MQSLKARSFGLYTSLVVPERKRLQLQSTWENRDVFSRAVQKTRLSVSVRTVRTLNGNVAWTLSTLPSPIPEVYKANWKFKSERAHVHGTFETPPLDPVRFPCPAVQAYSLQGDMVLVKKLHVQRIALQPAFVVSQHLETSNSRCRGPPFGPTALLAFSDIVARQQKNLCFFLLRDRHFHLLHPSGAP